MGPGATSTVNLVVRLVVISVAMGWVACSMGSSEPPSVTPEPVRTWVFSGPECPDAYPNCVSFSSDRRVLFLQAYALSNETFRAPVTYQSTPDLSIACINGSHAVMLAGGGPPIATGDTKVTGTVSAELTLHFAPKFGSEDQEEIYFDHSDSAALILLMLHAENHRPYLRLVASSVDVSVVADFDVRGIGTNLLRLACT